MRTLFTLMLLAAGLLGGCARGPVWAEAEASMPQRNAIVFDSPEMRWAHPVGVALPQPWYTSRNDAVLSVEAGHLGPVIDHSHRRSIDRRINTGTRVRDTGSDTTYRHHSVYLVR